jgi:nucleotide-binding universal stress UspA family protein
MQERVLVSGTARASVADDPMNGRNVLLATDFSECSAQALAYALGIARDYHSQLYVFHCVDPIPYALVEPAAVQQTCDDAQLELERLVLHLQREGRAKNVDVKVVVDAGDLAVILPELVENLRLGLVVVGTHGRTGWRKLLLGSVAEMVVDRVSCPVLCVGPSTDGTRIREFGPENILYANEGSACSQLAKSYAFGLARKYQCRLTMIDVFENRAGRVVSNVSQFEWREERSQMAPDASAVSCAQLPSEIGTETDLILRIADRTAADLIVLAVPEAHRFTDRFLLTNSYKVLCRAACPVLTVHAQ